MKTLEVVTMASNRKRRTIIEETLPPTTDSENPDTDVSDIIIVMSKVYRINAGSKSFCTQTTEPVDEVYLQSNYPAGGKYIVEEYNNMNQLVSKQNYEIEPKSMVTTNGNGNGSMSPHDVQIRMLFDELTFTRQLLMQQLAAGKSNGGSIVELVSALGTLHGLAPGGKDPIELLIKGMELGQNGGKVSSDWKDNLISAVKEIAPGAIQALAVANQKPIEGQPMIPTTPEAQLKANINWIKSKVITGMDVDLAVGWITNNSSDSDARQLLAMAVQGTIDNFIAVDPEIANEPYRTWFTTAIAEIKEWYVQQQQVQTDEHMDGRTGNNSDTNANATASVRSTR